MCTEGALMTSQCKWVDRVMTSQISNCLARSILKLCVVPKLIILFAARGLSVQPSLKSQGIKLCWNRTIDSSHPVSIISRECFSNKAPISYSNAHLFLIKRLLFYSGYQFLHQSKHSGLFLWAVLPPINLWSPFDLLAFKNLLSVEFLTIPPNRLLSRNLNFFSSNRTTNSRRPSPRSSLLRLLGSSRMRPFR